MKQNLLRFYLLAALVLLSISSGLAATTVIFDPNVDKTGENTQSYDLSLTKNGVTLDLSYGNMATTDGAYRIYKNATLKVSTTLGYISGITFGSVSSATYALTNMTANAGSYDGTTGQWTATSDISEVTFTASVAQTRTSLITVTIIDAGSSDYRPSLTDGFTFWPVMDEEPAAKVTITPKSGTLCYYTTDGSAPTTSSKRTSQAVTIDIHETTTVNAATYSNGSLGEVVSRTYTLGHTYYGNGDLLENAAVGDDIRLYWSDDMNARVLFSNPSGSQVYIRDNTGAILFYGVSTTPKLAKEQHLAGWIKGRVSEYGGVKQFIPNDLTNSYELVIAEPVTEEVVYPAVINDKAGFDAHQNDLVTLRNVRYDEGTNGSFDRFYNGSVRLYNRFNLSDFAYPYAGALVDLTGIAISYNGQYQIAALDMDNYYTYVINSDSTFNVPANDLSDVNVRLQRSYSLSKDYYTTMFLPFELNADNFNGEIYAYTGVDTSNSNYTAVKFETVEKSTPGVPCIVKPNNDMTEIKSNGTILVSATSTPSFDGRAFIGLYDSYMGQDGEHVYFSGGDFIKLNGAETGNFAYLRTSQAYFGNAATRDNHLKLMIDERLVGEIAIEGDVNGDGSVNAGDVSAVYNVMLGTESDAAIIAAADVNGDGAVNAGDVSAVYNIMLGASSAAVRVVPVEETK